MTVTEAVLQGILQGLTEFLPVSSDGHLTLYQHFTGRSGEGALLVTILMHLGTLLAVFVAYRKTIARLICEGFAMIADLFRGKFSLKNLSEDRAMVLMIIIGLVPLLVFYFVKDAFAAITEDADIVVEGVFFLITGLTLLWASRHSEGSKKIDDMRPRDALVIGTAQGFAALPAISRSGSTISAALLLGFSREFAVTYSFILGVPAVLAANVVEIGDAVTSGVSLDLLPLAVGVIVSAIVGFIAIKLINWLIKTNRFAVFGYYTIILGTVTVLVGIYEHIAGRIIF